MAGLVGQIGPYDENTEQWSSYTERFDCFVKANGIKDEVLVPTFLSVMGSKTYNLLRSLVQPNKPSDCSFRDVVTLLKEHFAPKPLIIAERFRFHKRNQLEGESIAQFVAVLKRLSEHCEFGATLNDTIRDRFVCGLRSETIQKRLLCESNLTLERAMEISVSMEMAAKEAQELSTFTQVNKVYRKKPKQDSKRTCYRCGKSGHLPQECWFKDKDCNNCGRKGHIERACQSKKLNVSEKVNASKPMEAKKVYARKVKKKHIHQVDYTAMQQSDDSDENELAHVMSVSSNSDGYWVTPLLDGKAIPMQVDTGAAVSLMAESTYKENWPDLSPKKPKLTLKTYTGELVPLVGVMDVTVELNRQNVKLPIYIVKGSSHATLMGRSWLEKIKINWQEVHLVVKESASLENILRKHAEVFSEELGSMKDITVKLTIKSDSTPKCLKARPVPYAIKPKVEMELDRLEKTGVLKKVSVSEWATPIVPVMKKDGSVRICGDFKVTINPVLTVEQYPLPLIDDLFAGLAGGKKLSKIDLCQAYLQMHVDPVSQELLTIVTHKGLYRYQRLPFGITSAPALFQRAMDQILSGLNGVQCYLDDLLITGKDDEDHLRNLNATLQRLSEYGLRVKKGKCEFFCPTVEYLGHVIDSAGLHKAPSKVKAIIEAPYPQNVSQLRSFLGLLTYYAKFMPNLASKLRPLHELLNKSKQWKWTEKCEKAFKDVKCTLTQSEVLTHFNPSLPVQLACDASPYGVGAVLSHVMPSGDERPIAFASRTLNKAESNYAQIEREALAIVFGVKKFHQYLFGRKFTLLTDHRPLTSIFGPKSGIPSLAASRMQRWALLLSAHQYDIRYRRSEQHCNADGLSRLPLPDTPPERSQADIFYFKEVHNAPVTAAQVKRFTRNDPVLSEVMDWISQGKRGKMSDHLRPYMNRQNELTVQSGCLLWGYRVIIPPPLRKPLLKELHTSHSGVVRMKEIARSYFWWPGLDAEIEEEAKICPDCQNLRKMPQTAPLHPWEFPEEPWQRVHIDFAGPLENNMFFVMVDAHSKWPEVAIMKNTTSEKTIEELRSVFSRFGLPQQIVSDNGPQLVSDEFQSFLSLNGIQHIRSAPYHPSTNGLAERFVQTLKKAIKASQGKGSLNQRLNAFLLAYRNTPHAITKVSPATALLKRQLRSRLDFLRPVKTKQTVLLQQQKQVERRCKAKFRSFNRGDNVLVRNYGKGAKWVPATVIAQTGPVSYAVETKDNVTWKRHVDQMLSAAVSSDVPCKTQIHLPKTSLNSGQEGVPEMSPTQLTSKPVVTDTEIIPLEDTSPVPETVIKPPVKTPQVPVSPRYPTRMRKAPQRLDL